MPGTPTLLQELKHIVFIVMGSTLLAGGVAFFLLPANIATGGTPGMAMIAHYLSSISTGKWMIIINIPLLLAGIKFIDLRFAIRTILSILLTSILIDFFVSQVHFPAVSNLLLAAIYGGICVGAGVGLVLKGNASAGGTTIIARIISSRSHFKPAQVILMLDMLIIIAIGFIFVDIEKALWSLISIYITSKIIDKVLTGVIPEKIVHITSTQTREIGQAIKQQLQSDGSILSGSNLSGDADKSIMFVLIEARRIPRLKTLVLNIDPEALMIVMEASEITGRQEKPHTSI